MLFTYQPIKRPSGVARPALRERWSSRRLSLAKLVGTAPSVIGLLEEADEMGHSLTMLRRTAGALDRRVEIRFVPAKRRLA